MFRSWVEIFIRLDFTWRNVARLEKKSNNRVQSNANITPSILAWATNTDLTKSATIGSNVFRRALEHFRMLKEQGNSSSGAEVQYVSWMQNVSGRRAPSHATAMGHAWISD